MKINVGDMVTLKPLKVLKTAERDCPTICVEASGYSDGIWLEAAAVSEVKPAPPRVGDRVKGQSRTSFYYEGELLGIHGDMAWVKWKEPATWVPHIFHEYETINIAFLTRIGGE